MKKILAMVMLCLLVVACGQSYEETKRMTRQQRKEAARKDSAALKIAVMPTLDCLPMYVAQYHELYDTIHGGVRLKYFTAQMDCDTALERGRVEGMVTDLVRATRIARRGTKMRFSAVTPAYWQLITNRNSRIRQLKQLDDKMVAMTRYSVTDMLADRAVDSAKLDKDHVFKVQVKGLKFTMDDVARRAGISKKTIYVAFRDKEMQRQARREQFDLFVKAYNQACDSINKYGLKHYRELIIKRCKIRKELVDSLPQDMKFAHAKGPRQQDIDIVEKWLGKK